MKPTGFRVESVVLCDDIRKEDNGKSILIGVYSGDVIVQQVPAVLNFSVWMQAIAEEQASSVGIKLLADENVQIEKLTTTFRAEPGNLFGLAVKDLIVVLPAPPAKLNVQIKFGNRDWISVLERKVILGGSIEATLEGVR